MENKSLTTSLTIITPFKDVSSKKLYKMINCLYTQNIKLKIKHLIIYDVSCPDFSHIKNSFNNKKNYFLEYIPTFKKGIYILEVHYNNEIEKLKVLKL